MTAGKADPHREARRRRRTAVVVIVLLAATLAIATLRQQAPSLGDSRWLAFERAWRGVVYRAGFLLPQTPDLDDVEARLEARGFVSGAPVFIRIFKREFELELWLARGDRFELFATYPICRFSGELGPKLKQGDKQAPEGIYTVARQQLNPASRWHRSFNLGFPNILDQHHGRTGTFLMVHGGCSSVGCYAMTNSVVDEVWHHVTRALGKGQRRFQVQVFPFRMTSEALAAREGHPWHAFWSDLKPAYDLFEETRVPPRAAVCDGRYTFAAGDPGSDGSRPLTKGCLSPPPVVTN